LSRVRIDSSLSTTHTNRDEQGVSAVVYSMILDPLVNAHLRSSVRSTELPNMGKKFVLADAVTGVCTSYIEGRWLWM